MSFPCTKCGCCCKRIATAVKNFQETNPEYKFPFAWDVTGKCEKLSATNECTVYEDRPLICNIGKMEKIFNLGEQTLIAACNAMMDEDGIDQKFRIK